MKKLFVLFLTATMLMSFPASVSAYNYGFESGVDTKETFGKPTQTDAAAYNPEMENVRRNKDAAFLPPPYGIFSGNIPTDPSSPYHDNSRQGYAGDITNYSASAASDGFTTVGGSLTATGENGMSDSGVLISTSVMESVNTQPLYYDDSSIGTLSIPKLNKTVKIYEGETLDSMRIGAGHFAFTSVWDGLVGIAGHNRGSSGYFEGVKNLVNGDTMTYTTKYGTRTYAVYFKEKISDTDYSHLSWSNDNEICLITCVEGVSNQRWVVKAQKVR